MARWFDCVHGECPAELGPVCRKGFDLLVRDSDYLGSQPGDKGLVHRILREVQSSSTVR